MVRLLALFLALALNPAANAADCGALKLSTQNAIKNANHCHDARDCIRVNDQSLFGCNVLANEAAQTQLEKTIADYKQACIGPQAVSCIVKTTPARCVKKTCRY